MTATREAGAAPGARASDGDTLDALRTAFGGLLGAERRLRGREGRDTGVSFAHFRLLIGLLEAPEGLPAGRLAATAELTPASTTQHLDLLEKRGLVVRERHPTDRRIVVAKLTGEGHRLTCERRTHFRALWADVLGDLTEDELQTGIKVVERMTRMLEVVVERKAAEADGR